MDATQARQVGCQASISTTLPRNAARLVGDPFTQRSGPRLEKSGTAIASNEPPKSRLAPLGPR